MLLHLESLSGYLYWPGVRTLQVPLEVLWSNDFTCGLLFSLLTALSLSLECNDLFVIETVCSEKLRFLSSGSEIAEIPHNYLFLHLCIFLILHKILTSFFFIHKLVVLNYKKRKKERNFIMFSHWALTAVNYAQRPKLFSYNRLS